MKLLMGWVMSAAAVFTAGAAHAQRLAPYEIGQPYVVASDVGGPYAGMPPEPAPPRYGPVLMPAPEVYTVVRESGFSPLGVPQQRGFVYTIAVINRQGDDGRLVIDARTGRIMRFMPAYRMGDNFNDDLTVAYGPVGPLPPPPAGDYRRGPPRPPLNVPRLASRTPPVPLPRAAPHAVVEPKAVEIRPSDNTPTAARPAPQPAQRSAAVQDKQDKPADVKATPAPAQTPTPAVEAKPAAPAIAPTQDMPAVQGLD